MMGVNNNNKMLGTHKGENMGADNGDKDHRDKVDNKGGHMSKTDDKKLPRHQLNNEGCRCEMCQKIVKEETLKIVKEVVYDTESEAYNSATKEYYSRTVKKLIDWDARTNRKLRYHLPEICIYDNLEPVYLISKRKETGGCKLVHDKTKLHMFEIIQFFLEGFVFHNPEQARVSRHNPERHNPERIGKHST